MLISDVSVRRPVFAAVISLILVIIGGMSVGSMPIREFPAIERPVVSITTSWPALPESPRYRQSATTNDR